MVIGPEDLRRQGYLCQLFHQHTEGCFLNNVFIKNLFKVFIKNLFKVFNKNLNFWASGNINLEEVFDKNLN